ncbi:MAG: esterase [Rubrivivax sp.]|nr:esterase [Rubrivivax sp.]
MKNRLKRFLTAAAAACLSASSLAASQIVQTSVASPTLGRDIRMYVYLPDGYAEANTRFPVIYMLHGAGGNESDWMVKGGIQVTADQQIARGELRKSVIVMPTTGPHSWYADANAEKAESAFVKELIPFAERSFNIRSDRAGRSIGGLSMGGYGALNLSLSHPELFCAAGVLSPAIYDPFPPPTSASRRTPQFTRNGQFDEAAWTQSLYPTRLPAYLAAKTVVPMWIESGDHDVFGIVLAAAKLYWTLHATQPKDIEYRVIDGDHDWLVFRESSVHALPYMSRKCEGLERR